MIKTAMEFALLLLRILREILGLFQDRKTPPPSRPKVARVNLLLTEAAVLLATFSMNIIQSNRRDSQLIALIVGSFSFF